MKTTAACAICGKEFTRVHTAKETPKHCSRACANKARQITLETRAKLSASRRAELHPKWTGGTWTKPDGRVFVRVPDGERHLHPTIRPDGYIRRYHYVWNMQHPDDPVQRGEILHHLNHDKTDDRVRTWSRCQLPTMPAITSRVPESQQRLGQR